MKPPADNDNEPKPATPKGKASARPARRKPLLAFKAARRAADATAEALRRQQCPVERAVLLLRSRGNRIVYRMSVHGGDGSLFYISGLGRDRTAAELLKLAKKVAA